MLSRLATVRRLMGATLSSTANPAFVQVRPSSDRDLSVLAPRRTDGDAGAPVAHRGRSCPPRRRVLLGHGGREACVRLLGAVLVLAARTPGPRRPQHRE